MLIENISPKMLVIAITRSLLFFPVVAIICLGHPYLSLLSFKYSQVNLSWGYIPKLTSAICKLEIPRLPAFFPIYSISSLTLFSENLFNL